MFPEVKDIKEGVKYYVSQYDEANANFLEAEKNWQAARQNYKVSSKEYLEAKAKYDDASSKFTSTAVTLIVLAASATISEVLCSTTMSTSAYRKKLESSGMDLEGKDVDHIIPKSKGGADHPINYELWDASKNRSCGSGCLGEKFANNPPGFVAALAMSAIVALNCGE